MTDHQTIAALVAALRARHIPAAEDGGHCLRCDEPWPCPNACAADALERVAAENSRLRAALLADPDPQTLESVSARECLRQELIIQGFQAATELERVTAERDELARRLRVAGEDAAQSPPVPLAWRADRSDSEEASG